MSPPNLRQQAAEARSEIDFRDTILINITLVYWYVSERIEQKRLRFQQMLFFIKYKVTNDHSLFLTFLASCRVICSGTSPNRWGATRLSVPVKVILFWVVPVTKSSLKCAVPLRWWQGSWRGWCGRERSWSGRTVEAKRNIWNWIVPATPTWLALWCRNAAVATTLSKSTYNRHLNQDNL